MNVALALGPGTGSFDLPTVFRWATARVARCHPVDSVAVAGEDRAGLVQLHLRGWSSAVRGAQVVEVTTSEQTAEVCVF